MKLSTMLVMASALAAAGLTVVTTAGCGRSAASIEEGREPAPGSLARAGGSQDTSAEPTGNGMAAMEEASRDAKYLFAFFWKEEDDQTAAMRSLLRQVTEEVADRADSVEVNVTAPSERAMVKKFELDRAPMPLILTLAPNGAVTGGFPTKVDKQDLLRAFVSPCTERCMKQLQENKLVFLCVQNAATQSNDAAMEGVRQFQADPRFAEATETVILDPRDAAEAEFLKDLQIDPKARQAVTVFLAPPGAPIAIYEGATSKDVLVSSLEKASSGCCPGGSCGPGGCSPK